MTKKCPACDTEVENESDKCPACGFDFSHEKKESVSNFINKEKNENIEWSEFKDMSIGHVMNIFNENEALTSVEKDKENKMIESADKNDFELDQETTDFESEQVETVEELSETDSIITEEIIEKNSTEDSFAFKEYLEEHRTDELVETEKTDSIEINSKDQPNESEKSMSEEKDENQLIQENQSDDEKKTGDIHEAKSSVEQSTSDQFGDKKVDLGKTQPFIPSKSKRPEEIEMDEAPIFFKDKDEKPGPKNISSNFVKPEQKSEEATTNTPKPEPSKTKQEKAKINYKKTAIILGTAIVLGGAGWYFYNQSQSETPDSTEVSKNVETLAKETKENLQNYFTSENQEFIKADMVSISPTTIKENLDKLKDSKDYKSLETTYQNVVSKQKTITQVNQLFEKPIIAGDKLNDVAIASDAEIKIEKLSGTNDFDKLINQAIDQATNQQNQLIKAQKAVAVFYQNGTITDSLTQEAYNTAKTEVDQVKSEKLKEPLTKELAEAEKKLVAQTEAAASVAEPEIAQGSNPTAVDETNQAQVIQSTGTPDASTFTGPNSQGIYTEPVYTVNPADVADSSNAAWIWAPGVQEKVIATCIERGYITAGNYSLQPARIINGEGYYNLYGGDGQYLVTINAQTGWFKGNASRNAGR